MECTSNMCRCLVKMIEMYYDYSSVEWEDLQATPLREIDERERKAGGCKS